MQGTGRGAAFVGGPLRVHFSLCFLRGHQSIGKYLLSTCFLPDAVPQVGDTAGDKVFNRCTASTYCMPDTVLGSRDKAVSKTELTSLLELLLQSGVPGRK